MSLSSWITVWRKPFLLSPSNLQSLDCCCKYKINSYCISLPKQKQTDSSGIESMCRDGKKKSCMNSLPHFHGFLLRLSEQGMEYRWRHWWTNESLWQNPKVNPATPRPLKKTGESTKESPEMGSSGSLQPHLRLTSEPCKLRTDPKQLSKRQKIQD